MRFRLAHLPTPLVRADKLAAAVGFPLPLLVKRDDLTGFGATGNKARPLEFLLGDALAEGCDVLVSGGNEHSNFCQAVALAASRAGLRCELMVPADRSRLGTPNLRIARRAGAVLHALGAGARSRVDDAVRLRAKELAAAGRRPYAIPRGGATPVGALGFAFAAEELDKQLTEFGIIPELVVIAVGSGASCAGLLASPARWRVLGVSVSRPLDELGSVLAACGAEHLDRAELVDARGPGFGVPAPEDEAAAELALRTEGLLLDHTYTAKSMAATLARLPDRTGPVVYWHTGGIVPAITEYC